VVELRLSNVNITGTGSFGVHISDCSLGDLCSEGGGGAGEGSPASISVELVDVVVDGAGFGRADADGVRVDDRGDGDIFFTATRSVFRNMGADGVELDEGDDGSVFVDVRSSRFEHNGDFCNAMQPPAPGGPCDDDGDPDVEDGFDVDEAGPGSVIGSIRDVFVTGNSDEGIDFDEEDEGGFDVDLVGIVAEGNADDGIKLTEDNDGDVQLSVDGSTINETLAISQKGNGDGSLRARGSAIHSLDLSAVDSI